MGKKQNKQQHKSRLRSKAAKKLLIIVAVVLVVGLIGVLTIQSSQNYAFEENAQRPILGNPQSSIVVTEFSDLECPACAAAHPTVQRLLEDYGDDIRFEYKHFPLRNIHPYAFSAAQAAECAHEFDLFKDYIDALFASQGQLSPSHIIDVGVVLGIPEAEFEACIRSGVKQDEVRADIAEGTRLGVSGTPTFFINGERVQTTQLIPTVAQLVDAQ